ncbi:MAG: WecB/TagA/CpsF family glycosyltransferase [Candidatus Marinimicrobia bacterium]|nr:WecB/TagA/CpsF family glycosyltransferase [Candidatus Neomarinimicrobiota bacterium]
MLEEFDHVFIDGISLVLILKLLNISHENRYSFDYTSVAKYVFEKSMKLDLSIFLIGSKRCEIEKAIKNIRKIYSRINIIGYRSGYFDNDIELSRTAQNISKINPDVLIVGMGVPLQERFLLEVKKFGWSGYGFTCWGIFTSNC